MTHAIGLLLLLAPVYFLLESSVFVYKRNPTEPENRAAASIMAMLFLLFLIDYAQQLLPADRLMLVVAGLKYPLAMLTVGMSLIMHQIIARRYALLPWPIVITIASLPALVYLALLGLYGPSFFFEGIGMRNGWPLETPNNTFYAYMLAVIVITILNNAIAITAWRRSNIRFDRKRLALLIRSNAIYFIAALLFVAIGLILNNDSLPVPSVTFILPTLIWGIGIRLMMVDSDFLPASTRKYEVLYNLSPVPIVMLDAEARIKEANPSAALLFGYEQAALRNIPFASFLEEADRIDFQHTYKSEFPNIRWLGKEISMRSADRQLKTVLMDMDMMAENGAPHGLALIRDITRRKEVEQYTAYLAHHDMLTGLPNRLAFRYELERTLENALPDQAFNAVLLIDLDRFKQINDSLGHQCGDEALREVASRLKGCITSRDMLSRLGGDEFIILVRELSEFETLIEIAESLLHALLKPVTLEQRDFFIAASIGISIHPSDGSTADTLIKNADMSMYYAKSNGGNQYRFFSNELNSSIQHIVEMETSLRKALVHDEFLLHYQPQINLADGRMIGIEALIRWNSACFGMVPPSEFIPLAEHTGLILPIGEWVLEEACREVKSWEDQGLLALHVSVNVSVKQFMQPDFVDKVKNALNKTRLHADKLCLEITESIVIDKLSYTLKVLDELVAMGVRISIDDFGTGYSSLGVLQRLPISEIKIDRSFIGELEDRDPEETIVPAMISMSHKLGKTVVAEGIETDKQMRYLMERGCNVGQGFYFDKPLTSEQLIERMKADFPNGSCGL